MIGRGGRPGPLVFVAMAARVADRLRANQPLGRHGACFGPPFDTEKRQIAMAEQIAFGPTWVLFNRDGGVATQPFAAGASEAKGAARRKPG